jgi:NAD(P)-dependent dehydrogenase (short-subunit alcohol dehydrogenase family)
LRLDVNDNSSAKDAITKIVSEKGRIDIVVNNADYGLACGLEDASMEEIKSQFETNLFGLMSNTGSSSNNEKEFWRIVVKH